MEGKRLEKKWRMEGIKRIPPYISCRKQYSVASEQNAAQGSGPTGKPPESGSSLPKIIVGTLTLGAVLMTAYHLNQRSIEGRPSILESLKVGTKDPVELSKSNKDLKEDGVLRDKNVMSDLPHPDDLSKHEESQFQANDEPQSTPKEDVAPVQEKELPTVTSDDESKTPGASLESTLDMKPEVKSTIEQHEAVENTPILPQGNTVAHGDGVEQPKSLLNEYNLGDKVEETISTLSEKHKDLVDAIEDSNDAYLSKDGKLVVDFLQAIHAAEKRQAELDAHIFAEEKRKMKEKYEKELKDARARELMYAEETAIMDKELNRERLKATAALKSLREELEDKLRIELEQKETEAESRLKNVQELSKAELAAAIASEKASLIEKMAEANLHINALCMAFYARSEEARQSHSVHKLALGALALEDALSQGLPIEKEIHALHTYLEGDAKDPLLDLVLSSIPKETQSKGTDTILQLKHKASFLVFDTLKGTLRHFSLIPPGGGGILTHSLAHVASSLKVKEADQSGDGIESLINRVESLLAEGKLSEAADSLENGVKGTQAAEVINDWLRQVRNRAITEQALTFVRAYATAISLT
ncbi:hypothetical protein RHGRI_029952 [Rhododendron griersonianum]|uniref:MICOS complex subunit MIC60 n=1 Tax=Rhododendron griersonianum TaxID=479676 RepID=A0AAV6INU4_9ERIC|nr:hypothetical protein RHGRI_029952 [Rhododendron griersonianum]